MIKQIAGILVLVGAINWGLIGAFNVNIVSALVGSETMLEKVIYILVGASGVSMLYEMYAKTKK